MLDNKQAYLFLTQTKPANKTIETMAQLAARYCKKQSGLPAKYFGNVKYGWEDRWVPNKTLGGASTHGGINE